MTRLDAERKDHRYFGTDVIDAARHSQAVGELRNSANGLLETGEVGYSVRGETDFHMDFVLMQIRSRSTALT